jgi:predicted nuclease of predicted toxin-antitoxin system
MQLRPGWVALREVFLDHNVPASVRRMLISQAHECWTAAEAGLAEVRDDNLSVYADSKRAALISFDREFNTVSM